MARQKKKTCLYCFAPLSGRRDAKTCSDRCRKRLQRTRLLLEKDLERRLSSSAVSVALDVNMPLIKSRFAKGDQL
jgi:predicted nucleic acid-binding Zn ribbon protein